MCGRFTLTVDPGDLMEVFPGITFPQEIRPRYNIAPSQPVAVIANTDQGKLDFFTWGLIPSWAKDPSIGSRMINARAETLAEKPAFKAALRRRRCLILGDGFFEWESISGQKTKQPHYFQLANQKPFGFAGLWEIWFSPDGSEIRSCTIITTTPNKLVEPIHNRMPAIIMRDDYSHWLSTGDLATSESLPLLKPFPESQMKSHPVSLFVNNPANDSSECILPIKL